MKQIKAKNVIGILLFTALVAAIPNVGHSQVSRKTACKETDKKGIQPTLRVIMTFDSEQMENLVSHCLNQPEIQKASDEEFYTEAAHILADIALLHPRFSEREAALSRIKNKMDQDEYYGVMKKAADRLLAKLKPSGVSSNSGDETDADQSPSLNLDPAEQASALVALTNWVVEAKNLPQDEMGATLQKIATADIEISDDARAYGREPLKTLVSPSDEAKVALAKFGSENKDVSSQ